MNRQPNLFLCYFRQHSQKALFLPVTLKLGFMFPNLSHFNASPSLVSQFGLVIACFPSLASMCIQPRSAGEVLFSVPLKAHSGILEYLATTKIWNTFPLQHLWLYHFAVMHHLFRKVFYCASYGKLKLVFLLLLHFDSPVAIFLMSIVLRIGFSTGIVGL